MIQQNNFDSAFSLNNNFKPNQIMNALIDKNKCNKVKLNNHTKSDVLDYMRSSSDKNVINLENVIIYYNEDSSWKGQKDYDNDPKHSN